ncbi:MAG: FkbM family methyltransferase [Pseudomonadota bacterium]
MTLEKTIAAECLGVRVPDSRFLNPSRIAKINSARYEGREIAGALHVVTAEDTVLEIGAGIGIVGAVIARNAAPKSVHSYEANVNLIQHIRALYDENDLSNRISVRNEILLSAPDRPASIEFHLRDGYLGSSILNPLNRPSTVVNVPTMSFADVCDRIKPTVLVMDIEGGELDLLRHADLSPFRAIVLEYHPEVYGVEGMRECKAIVRDAGFVRIEEKSNRTVWTCVRT